MEGSPFPLAGWAATVGAVDLTQPDEPAAALHPLLAEAVDRLHWYGNNGYHSEFDRRTAAGIVDELYRAGLLDGDVVLGALAARGPAPRALKRLEVLIDRTG